MKKLIAVILLFVYLISFQEFRQTLKFPTLIEQFVKHQIINHDYTFIGFFEHHYFKTSMDSDYEQDMKMPFRTYDFNSYSSSLVFIIHDLQNFILESPKNIIIEKNTNFLYKQNHVTEFRFSIFQPPEFKIFNC